MSEKTNGKVHPENWYHPDTRRINMMVLSAESLEYSNGEELNGDYFIRDGKFRKFKGLGWVVTALFVVGDMAGGGLVAMPTAMIRFGFWVGIAFMALITLLTGYTSHLLGRNWLIMQRRWPLAYASSHCRKPYPEMAQRAVGTHVRNLVSICINITQFGIAVVYLLLSAKNIHSFLRTFFDFNMSFCTIVFFVAMALLPVTFLKSPQDFWVVVVVAMFTTTFAVLLILVGTALDYNTCAPYVAEAPFTFTNYFLALGTFVFSYGGHAVFPTIQHDMRKPYEFTKSTVLAFTIVVAMYAPVCILGYLVYGNSLRDSIIESLQTSWIQQSVNILITIHCILTLTIVFNPMNQEAEEHFNVPHYFCGKRVLVRTGMMCAVVFVAESLPNFEPLLDLVGGSTLTLTSLVFPTMFHILLKTNESIANNSCNPSDMRNIKRTSDTSSSNAFCARVSIPSFGDIFHYCDLRTLFCCGVVIVFALLGGSAATFSAIKELSYAKFVPPCYVNALMSAGALTEDEAVHSGLTACCGSGQNLTQFANTTEKARQFCLKPDHSRYF